MKKHSRLLRCVLSAILVLVMTASFFPVAVLAEGEPIVRVSSVTSHPGETVSVTIDLINNPGVAAANIILEFGDNIELQGVTYYPKGTGNPVESLESPLTLAWINSGDVTVDFTFATLTFVVKENITARLSEEITIASSEFTNYSEVDIDFTAQDGSIEIIPGLPGDVNGDKKRSMADVVRMSRYFAGHTDPTTGKLIYVDPIAIDVNGDKRENMQDLTRLLRFFGNCETRSQIYYGSFWVMPCRYEMTAVPYKAPTCEEAGNEAYWYCKKCDKYYSDINATKLTTQTSTLIPATEHTVVVDPAVPATSTSTGLTEGSHCSVCGKVLVPQSVIPMLTNSTMHSITYDITNGDSYLARQTITNTNPDSYKEGTGLTLANLSVPGYRFLGWYDGAGDNATRITKIPATSTDNYELYAHWAKISYKVQFISALYPIDTIYYTVDTGIVLPTPSLSNYVFTGWTDESGSIFSRTVIPAGTIGDLILTANWTSERNKAFTYTNLADPIIYEDEENNVIYFAYEIGEMQNVPLYTIKDFGYISGDGVTKTETAEYSMSVTETAVESYASALSEGTTRSLSWTLSSGWSNSTSVDEQWCNERNMTVEEAKSRGTSETGSWNVSNGKGGSYTSTRLSTDQTNKTNEVKLSGEKSHTNSNKVAAGVKSEASAEGFGLKAKISGELSAEESYSGTSKNGLEIGGKKDDIHITTKTSANTSTWNMNSSYGGSNTSSLSESTSYAIADKISEKTGYGRSYISNGNQNNTEGTTSTRSESEEYTITTTYSTKKEEKVTRSWTTQATKPGYHRWVVAGTMHVFALVGYDMETRSYFVNTYSLMDDYTYEFEDYSYTSNNYNDNQNGLISFEVPHYVSEYVADKTVCTDGLEVDVATGRITAYTGTDNAVIIPDYMLVHSFTDANGTEHYDIVKVTGISENAFKGNQNIVVVRLPEAVETIPARAFDGCTSLVGILGGNIMEIGDYAFSGCTSIECAAVHSNVTSLGISAFDGANRLLVNAANTSVVEAAVNSGAKNIVIYTNHLQGDTSALSGKALTIPEGTESFEMNGYSQKFVNLKIVSNAEKTVLHKMNIVSNTGTPIQLSSSEVVLNQVNVSSNNLCLVLKAEMVDLKLQGTIGLTSGTQNTMLSRNVVMSKNVNNASSQLSLSGKMLVCGNVTNQQLLANQGSEIKTITQEEYELFVGGVIVITMDANGGDELAQNTTEAFRNHPVGVLPDPTREYYDFGGWYTDPLEGTLVTSESDFEADTTIYAHWIPRTYELSFNSNGGNEIFDSITAFCDQEVGHLPIPTRPLYTFNGWYTEQTGGEEITATTVKHVAEDLKLYAHWAANQHTVTFIANGNSVTLGETSKIVTCDAAIGALPTATRDYYRFDGWYTESEGGTKFTDSTFVTIDADFALYAHWTPGDILGWTPASDIPSDAQVVEEKWTYTLTSNTESTAPSMSGWTQTGNYWKQTGSGSTNYASFPSGFDTGHSIYKSFAKSAYNSYDNGSTKRTVNNAWAGYVYWHWMYDCGGGNGIANRAILDYKGTGPDNGFYYKYFGAFTSTTGNYSNDKYYCNSRNITNYIIPGRTAYSECQGATRWFRFDYYKSTYTDYQRIYQYQKVENLESGTPVYGSNTISNVQHWVLYRVRVQANAVESAIPAPVDTTPAPEPTVLPDELIESVDTLTPSGDNVGEVAPVTE